jgi:hypothetical protein
MEEVTSRVSTFTQDLEYAKCYGQLTRYSYNHTNHANGYGGFNYDYAEDADPVYDNDNDNECCQDDNAGGVESTQQMLQYFDENNKDLYKQQEQQQEQQQESLPESKVDIVGQTTGTYHEEAVIIEGEEDVVKTDKVVMDEITTKGETETTTALKQETQKEKRKRGWLSSWF